MNAPVGSAALHAPPPDLRGKVPQWAPEEDAILLEHYATGAAAACLPYLPGRTLGSIYQRARKLDLHAPRYIPGMAGVKGKKYFATDAIDDAIRAVYTQAPTRNAVRRLAIALMRPRWWVSKRAAVLGLVSPRFKEPPWSAAEIELVRENAHKHLDVLRRLLARNGYTRTTTAIGIQVKRRGFDTTDPNHYTAHQLAALLGVDGKTITRWIAVEGLPASKRGTMRTVQQGGDQWWIHRAKLRAWIGEHAQLIDLRKVERFWFLDLVFHAK